MPVMTYLVSGIDLVDATRFGNGPADVQLQIASNIRTIRLWARVTIRPRLIPPIIESAVRD